MLTLAAKGRSHGRYLDYLAAERWIAQAFSAEQIRRGGVLKRQIRDAERPVERDAVFAETRWRGLQVVQTGRHFVIFCDSAPHPRVA